MEKSVKSMGKGRSMIKHWTLIVVLTLFWGCSSTVKIPEYIQDIKPFTKTYFASYDKTFEATKSVLQDLGWTISALRDPLVFERNPSIDDPFIDKVMIVTEVKESGFFIGTRYSRLNLYLHSVDKDKTAVEVRFLTETALPYNSIRSYDHQYSAEHILAEIEKALNL